MAKRSYDTQAEREDYVIRVMRRTSAVIAEEAPPGIGGDPVTWEEIQPKNDAALVAGKRFEEGHGTKEAFDEACLALIGAWRRQFEKNRNPNHPSLGTQAKS